MSKLPNKVKCTCCGDDKAVRAPVLEKRIKKFGSLDKLLAEYVCRDCLREVNERVDKVFKDREGKLPAKKGKKDSIIMQKYLNGELWFQQPGYVFPAHKSAEIGLTF